MRGVVAMPESMLSLGMGAVTDFEALAVELRPRLVRAFVAAYGAERGHEALAEAFAWAWENFDSLRAMENPAGYLYRVGQSRTRPRRPSPHFHVVLRQPVELPHERLACRPQLLVELGLHRVVVHGRDIAMRRVAVSGRPNPRVLSSARLQTGSWP